MVAAAVQTAFVAAKPAVARQSRSRVVRVAALQQQEAPAAPLRFLAAGLAAAAVATCGSPAEAGVVLRQPEVKNFVNNTAPAPKAKEAAAQKAAPAEKTAAEKKAAAEESGPPGAAFEAFRPVVLPLTVVLLGAAGAAAVKLDPEIAALFDESWSAKNSIVNGAGYETAPGLKDTPFYGGSNTSGPVAAKKSKTGTKVVAKKATIAGTIKSRFFG